MRTSPAATKCVGDYRLSYAVESVRSWWPQTCLTTLIPEGKGPASPARWSKVEHFYNVMLLHSLSPPSLSLSLSLFSLSLPSSLSLSHSCWTDPHHSSAGQLYHEWCSSDSHTGANGGQPDDQASQKTLCWQYSFWGDWGELAGP